MDCFTSVRREGIVQGDGRQTAILSPLEMQLDTAMRRHDQNHTPSARLLARMSSGFISFLDQGRIDLFIIYLKKGFGGFKSWNPKGLQENWAVPIDYSRNNAGRIGSRLGTSQKQSSLGEIQSRVWWYSSFIIIVSVLCWEIQYFLKNRTLELLENGLISSWLTRLEPNTRPCWNNDKGNSNANKSDKKPLVRLTLMNLTGAFLVLAVGSLVSVLAFLTEGILSHYWKRHQQMTSIA